MVRFAYATPILANKSDRVREYYRDLHWAAQESGGCSEEQQLFCKLLNVSGWSSFLQELRGLDYLLHLIDAEDSDEFFFNFRDQIRRGHPIALELHEFHLEVLGRDYAEENVAPKIEEIFYQNAPYTDKSRGAPIHKRTFIYPLLPGSAEGAIRLYEEPDASRYREFLSFCGMVRMSIWIQSSSSGDYLVYNTEIPMFPTRFDEQHQANYESDWYKRAILRLSELTGLTFSEFMATVEHLSSVSA